MVLAFLMALGLFATISGIIKLSVMKALNTDKDGNWDSVRIEVFAYVVHTSIHLALYSHYNSYYEEYIGITAACIPPLKALLEKGFRALGGQITSVVATRPTGAASAMGTENLDGTGNFSMQTYRGTNGSMPQSSIMAYHKLSDIENGKVVKEVEISWMEDRANDKAS